MEKIKNLFKVFMAILIFISVLVILYYSPGAYVSELDSASISVRYLEFPSGNYSGEVILGNLFGKGSFYFDTGEVYQGLWNMNEMQGNGKLTYTSGSYDGDFVNSKRSGNGTFSWEDGSIYNGTWFMDKLNGNGTLISKGITYNGEFKDNRFIEGNIDFSTETGTYNLKVENGVLNKKIDVTFKSGTIYSGEFYGSNITGNGIMTFPGVGTYKGDFYEGKRSGTGSFNWEDGASYTGAWKNDLIHGFGRYNITYSTYLEGTFENGKLNGTYTYHNSDGNYKTKWKNGKCTSIVKE